MTIKISNKGLKNNWSLFTISITWAKGKVIKSWQQTAQQILHQQIFWGKKICVLSRTAFSSNLLKKLQNLEIRQLITKKGNPYIAGIINPVCSLGLLIHSQNICTVGCKTIFYLLLCCWLSKGKKCLSFEAFL